MKKINSIYFAKGISLIELMIGLVIGLAMTGAISYLYVDSSRNYRISENLARMQESGRFAMDLLAKDLRLAGFWGCATGRIPEPVNTLNTPDTFLYDFSLAVSGFNGASDGTWNPTLDASLTAVRATDDFNPNTSVTLSLLPGTDVLAVRGPGNDGSSVTQHPGQRNEPASADIKVTTGSGIKQGDILMISDCTNSAIFQVTHINTANGIDNLGHNTGILTPGNRQQALGKSYTGGFIARINTIAYFIANNTQGRPALFRKRGIEPPLEIADNVDDFQVLYGVDEDEDPDRTVDAYREAQDVTDWALVRSVRLTVRTRSQDDNLATTESAEGDHRLRLTLTSTVGLRNRLP